MNEWISIEDENNLPQGECIAIGYQNEMLIGYISKDESGYEGSNYIAENDYAILTHITHYMIPDLPNPSRP